MPGTAFLYRKESSQKNIVLNSEEKKGRGEDPSASNSPAPAHAERGKGERKKKAFLSATSLPVFGQKEWSAGKRRRLRLSESGKGGGREKMHLMTGEV